MIFEYALEPSLLNNWHNFRYFFEKFGVSHGRLISRYPKYWKRLVYESLHGCGEIEKKRIEEKLANINNLLLPRMGVYDPNLNWNKNAEIEHCQRPFHAIIAANNPENKDYILEADSLCDSFPLWNIPHTVIINRTAEEISTCAKQLIFVSKELIFIDPYFSPDKLSYRRPLELILEIATSGPQSLPLTVEVHLKDILAAPYFKEQCKKHLPPIIPKSIVVKFYMWRERPNGDQIHNRFLLTDSGGIRFGAGLCEGTSGQTDEVELLDETVVKERRANFSKETSAFDLVEETDIKGEKID